MKILFIGVGLTHYYNRILNLFVKSGVDVWNLVPAKGAGHAEVGVFQQESEVDFRLVRLFDYGIGQFHRFYRGLGFHLLKSPPDLIVVTDVYLFSVLLNPVVLFLKFFGRTKILLKTIPFRLPMNHELRDSGRWKWVLKSFLNRWAFNWVDGHLNYIDDGKRIFGSYGVPDTKIFKTGNSPDTDYLNQIREKLVVKGVSSNRYQVIHVGRLTQGKRVDLLLAAIALVKKAFPQVSLMVVGDGPERRNLESQTTQLNLNDSVSFVGSEHDYERLGERLISSGCYVLAGMGGLSINDAMAFGLPVIVSVGDGTEKDLVYEGQNGYFFEQGNQIDLAKKIETVLADANRQSVMGAASLEIIRTRVNCQIVVKRYLDAFNSVNEKVKP